MKVTPELLERVQWDNIRDNQLSQDGHGGISEEVAADIGFTPTTEVTNLLKTPPEIPEEVAVELGYIATEIEDGSVEITLVGDSSDGRKKTITEKNKAERRHIARARRLRWGK